MQQLEGTQTLCRGMQTLQTRARTRRVGTICNSNSRFFSRRLPATKTLLVLHQSQSHFCGIEPQLGVTVWIFFRAQCLAEIPTVFCFSLLLKEYGIYMNSWPFTLNAIHAFCVFCRFCACCLTYCPHSAPPKQFNFPKFCKRHSPTHAKCENGRNDSPYQRFVRLDPYVYALKVRQDLVNLHRA